VLPGAGQLLLSLPRSKGKFYLQPKEKDVEASICQWLRVKGFFFWKQTQSGYFDSARKCFRKHASPYVKAGVPDIIVIYKGRFIGIEVKSKSGKQSIGQLDFERDVLLSDGIYFIARSIEDVDNEFRKRGII
jgi:hypothetical protein